MHYRDYFCQQIYPVYGHCPDCLFYQISRDGEEWFFAKACPSSSPKVNAYHRRFQYELRAMKPLNCECIPKYYQANSQNHTFVLMEYVKGQSLAQFLSHHCNTSTPCEILNRQTMRIICRQIHDTLLYLRENGILYLDLTPENVILTDSQFHLKLVDFTSCYFKQMPLNDHLKVCNVHLEPELPTDYLLTQLFALFCARLFYKNRRDFIRNYSYQTFMQYSADSHYGLLFKYGLHPDTGDPDHSSFRSWYQWLDDILAR